jgi:hypothetical protein
MGFWVGVGVLVLLIITLAALGNRRRRGVKPWQLQKGRDPKGVMANQENALRQRSHPGNDHFPF